MEIKVLGTGCAKCKKLYAATEEAVKEMNLDANYEKVEDIERIMSYGVISLPAIVVDGKVAGKGVLSKDKVKEILQKSI